MNYHFKVRVFSIVSILSMLFSAVSMPTSVASADSPAGIQEGFESGWSDHAFIDASTNWYSANGVYVENDFGTGGTWGLSNSANIFTWMGHPFQWSDPTLTGVLFGIDFQANASGQFDDDRIGWMIVGSNITSDNFFGVQMDPGGTGQNIEAYWDGVTVNDGGRTSIVSLTGISANAWYRLRAEITKLTSTSAKIDVTLTALDASGNPGAVVASGTLLDTSLLPDTTENYKPKPGYFTATAMYPAFKNHNGTIGNADNVYFEILTSAATPVVTTTGTLSTFTSQAGIASAEQSYTVAGSSLTSNIIITAPTDFQVSTTSGSGFGTSVTLTPTSGTVASTPIYIRFNRPTAGSSGGNITHTSTGATAQNVAVSGTATQAGTITFAAFGDYGANTSNEQPVADLVNSWSPDFIVTTGDNSYGSAAPVAPAVTTIDQNIGKYYHNYIGNYIGGFTPGSATNRFFPAMGNHDYTDGGGSTAYFNYFSLPNNERYFDFVQGPVHFFVIDSNPAGTGSAPGDGRSASSAQGTWLQAGLAASTSPWNIVYFHHPPFSSATTHGSDVAMRWPFEAWGATAVFSGHDHTYERVMRDDNSNGVSMPYFVTGAGGYTLYNFGTPVSGSAIRYNANYGSMRIQATSTNINFEFWSVAGGGTLIDTYMINQSTPTQTLPINTGSTWKYLDNGTDQGTAWTGVAFDDSSWASGPAELGYGDGGEATVVDCSAVANCNSNNYITTYFRKAFNVPDKSIYSVLNLRLLRDDGAVVYLNGTEVWRTNMPAGAVTYTTLSPTAIGGTDETTFVNPTSVLANTLVNGTNVLAVEIHQQAITSTDISFDLELTGVISTPICYALTLGHTGNGTTPTASPTNSTGCSAGQYISGEVISLSGATPDSGWQIAGWYGTSNNTSTASTNSLTMPANVLSAGVNYTGIPSGSMVCESFNAFTPGLAIGTYTGWYDGGSGPVVTSGNGVAGSIGLAPSGTIFTWTAHPFDWNAADFVAVRLQGDFQTNATGQFDDDRLAWTINNASTSSDYEFGVQLDPGGTGHNVEAYWDGDTFGDDGGRTSIVSLPTLTGNAWYRLYVQMTKLTTTSAKLDVTLTALDASGNPGAVVASGSIADTALLPNTTGEERPNAAYFTGSVWPNYKNHNGTTGAMDNICYEVVTGEPPVQYTLITNTVGSGGIILSPSGGSYNQGTVVQLTATPAIGWAFSGWSGNLAGTTNPASITMDANKNVIATFTQLPPVTLTVNAVGSGTVTLNPAGGSYAVGTVVQVSAAPDANWLFSGWSGDLTGTTNPASITMNANKTVTATFTEVPPAPSGVCESFNTGFTPGQVVGAHADWFDSDTGPVVTSGNGLAGTVGLAPGSSIFTWTAHPFNWNDPAFESINFSMDYQTNASGQFDDDRLGWMTSSTSADSANFFGVQLDTTEDGGIVTFWRDAAGTRIQTPIVPVASFSANTWYRFDAIFTKLTATSARIDVNLVQLDASGNPTGTPITGTLDDTSTWPGGAAPDTYFTPTSMWPAYKNHSAITGAADNTCFDIVSGSFAFVVTTDWHTSDTYPNGGITTKVGQIADWMNNPTSSMPAPEFMVITGDFPHLTQTDTIINTVLGNDFLWYPVIGNHEMDDITNDFNVIRDTVVPSLPNIVDNGPTGSENTTYSFDYENAHFVVINPFWDGASNDHTSEGDISTALNSWINSDLTANDETHNFAFIHTPAYPDTRHVGEDLDAPANRGRRDAFVATLNANNVETLFAGHTHYYEHDVAPEYPLGNLDQVTNGALRSGETSTITYVLVEGSTTTYKVYMWNGSAFTLHEQWSIGGTPPSQPPTAPTTLTASAVAYNQINLSWNDNANNETGFEIERSTTGSVGTFIALASVLTDVEAYTNGGLTAQREYCYRVRAVNAAGQSTYSNVACATTPEQPPVTLTCESFDSLTPGSTLGTYAGWYDGGSGPVVTSGNGVLNSIGLAPGTNIYNWTAHPFNWNASTFDSVTLQQDFMTDSAGQFDDDRMAWTTLSNSTDSLNQFGVQLDHLDGGIVTYWRTSSDVRVQTPIVTFQTLPVNTWYRFNAKITKLTATSAQIDVSLTQLDGSGNPTGTVYSGSVANTSTWSGGAPAARYFTATTMWPSYKAYNSAASAPADNACYEIATGEPPQQYTLTVNSVGSGSVVLNPAGGTYDEGTIVQLTANPISGWSFNTWSGDLSGNTNPASIVMNSNKNITATFVQQTGDLVGYWKFDASSGTTAADSSTYGNTGTVNGATWTTGKVNNGLSFDGTNDYVQIPNSASLSLSTNRVTIAGWVYPTNISGSWTTIIQRSNTNGSWFDWQLYSRAADAPTPNRPVFRVDWNRDGAMDGTEQVQGDIILQANTWYYVAATYDGTAMRFYIDGTLRGTTNISGATIPASNKPVWIGGNDAWGEYFPGRIDEFRIYNRALSQSEIQNIMNPPTCYALNLSHTGTGSNPTASPANSTGCSAGQYVAGTTINLSGAVPSTGWQIGSWTGTNNNSSTASTNTVTMPASARTASVNYSQIEYTLTANVAGGGSVATSPNQATYHYGDVVQLTATPNAGWSFGNWSGDLTGTTNPASITINGNKNVTATFTQNQYTLAITSVHGTVMKSPDKTTYTYGEVVQLTSTPDAGWSFANWSGDASGINNPVSVTMAANKVVTANYTQNQYTLTITSAHGTVAKNPDKTTYTYGEVVQLTSTPDVGWSFANWSGDATGTSNPTLVTMTSDKAVTASYTQNEYTLTVNVVGNGVVGRSPDQASYYYGEVVQVSAVPDTGWQFSAWSGDASGTASPVSVTMDGNKNVTATFSETTSYVFPSGMLTSWGNTFSWPGVTGATWYLVQAQAADDTVILQKWYTAEAAGCSGDLSCVVSPEETLNLSNGGYKWRILDYGDYGYGNWTPHTNFNLNAACYSLTTGVLPAGSGTVTASAQNCSGGYIAGTVVQLTALPNSGYAFTSWSGDVVSTANPVSFTMNADKNITANFTALGATLISPAAALTSWNNTFSWTGVTGASWYLVQVQAVDDTVILQKWYTADAAGCSGDLSCVINPDETLNLMNGDYKWRILDYGDYGYGNWSVYKDFALNAACYSLTTSVLPVGSGTVTTSSQNCGGGYLAGTVVQLTAVVNSGYGFSSWSGDAVGTSNPVFVTMNAEKNITANFTALGATLISPAGALTSWDNTFNWTGITGASWYLVQAQAADDTVILQKWYTAEAAGCAGDLSCAVSPAETLGLANGDYKWRILDYGLYGYGNWTPYTIFNMNAACYSLTTKILPAGGGTLNASTQNCSGGYLAGTVVQLTAIVNSGYGFSSWSGDVVGTSNPVFVTMNAEKNITANFTALGATLISPAGALTNWDNTFSWTGVTGASWYLVQVQSADDTVILQKWYTVDAAGCSGDLSCSVSPEETLILANGDYKWRILDYGGYGYGSWSPYTTFTLTQ